MFHKKIHTHVKKHAQRAHTHVTDHGHKRLWLLSLFFVIILAYPYFSNANGSTVWAGPVETITAEIEYDPTEPTNWDVIATVTGFSAPDVFVRNNNGNNSYTFTENWEFTFTLQNAAGEGGSVTATVDWITEEDTNICEDWFEPDAEGNCIETEENQDPETCEDWSENPPYCDGCPRGQKMCNDNCVNEHLACEWPCPYWWAAPNCNPECSEWQEWDNQQQSCVDMQNPIIPLIGTFSYDPQDSTTWPVIVTLSGFSTTGVTITNNDESNMYTFTENWSFTFEFENEDGATGSATAMVDWIIDEEPPVQECAIEITSPSSGDSVWWSFPIQRESNEDCDDDSITIQLRDHNNQRMDIGTWFIYDEEFVFASTGLASTGRYTITGLHLSGTTREIEDENGAIIDSGTYVEDTPYIVYTGAYTGEYTDFATGYMLRLVDSENNTILTELEGTFTIDNQAPEILERNESLSGHYLTGGTTGEMTYILWSESILTFNLTGSEELTWFTLQISGSSRGLEIIEDSDTYNYILSIDMKKNKNLTWDIEYILQYQDIANNQASKTWTRDNYTIDTVKPNINDLSIQRHEGSWSQDGSIGMAWETDKATVFDIAYGEWEEEYTVVQTESYDTEHSASLTWIEINVEYWFIINIYDQLQNHKVVEWTMSVDNTGELTVELIQESDDILQMSEEVETSLYLQILQNEVNKFKACRENLTYNQQTIDIWENELTLLLPVMSQTRVKNAMAVFILPFVNKVKTRTELSQAALHEIANIVNNFLVVLKLTDDDNNACEQKVSNYYMGQFGQMMEQMNFF